MGIVKTYCRLIALFCFATSPLFAQNDKEIVQRNGKPYYLHIVQQGNTLWGLHTQYDVPVDAIVNENPGIDKGISVGQTLYIPIKEQTNNSTQAAPATHVVQGKETLYGISKQYNIPIEQLITLNPGADKGLQIGQVLQLTTGATTINQNETSNTNTPSHSYIFSDSVVEHTVLDHETLYAISKRFMVSVDTLIAFNNLGKRSIHPGEKIKIPLKNLASTQLSIKKIPANQLHVNDVNTTFSKKENYVILVLLPMNFGSNAAVYSNTDPEAKLNKYTKIALDFYMGIKLALDSLSDFGLNATVKLVDTRVDSSVVYNYLKTLPKENRPDLIIGPLMPNPLAAAARWCKINRVPLLSPVAAPSNLLKENPYFFSSVPSDFRLLEGMADELAQNHANDNLVLVTSGNSKDDEAMNIVRNHLGARAHLREVSCRGELNAMIQNDKNNIFIFPSANRVSVSYFMTSMSKIKNTKGEHVAISVYGLKEWEGYEELKLNYKAKLNLHYPSSINLHYADSTVQSFIHAFRSKYKVDPSKYAIQGFDVSYAFIASNFMQMPVPKSIMNQFHYANRGEGNGEENNNVFIMSYEGYDLKEVAHIHE